MLAEGAGIGPSLQPDVRQNAQEGPQGDKAARQGEDPARPVEGLPTASERLQTHPVGRGPDLVLKPGHALGGPVPGGCQGWLPGGAAGAARAARRSVRLED